MKNEENWTKMKKNEENENQIGAINHSQTLYTTVTKQLAYPDLII